MAKVSLFQLEFIIFDFETTGLEADKNDEIIEIGAVKLKGSEPTGEIFHSLIDIGKDIPPEATKVNGLTNKDIKGQPSIEEVFPKFIQFIGNKILIAHNASFDLKFVYKNLKRFPEISFANYCLDTVQLSKKLFSYEKHHNLDALTQRFELRKEGDRHRSVGDCLLTAKIFSEFLKTLKRRRMDTLEHIKACITAPPKRKLAPATQSLSLF